MVGLEPTTPALRKPCSTIELHRRTENTYFIRSPPACKAAIPENAPSGRKNVGTRKLHDRQEVRLLCLWSAEIQTQFRAPIAASELTLSDVGNVGLDHESDEQEGHASHRQHERPKGQTAAEDLSRSRHERRSPYCPPKASMSAASLSRPVARLFAMKSSRPMKKTGMSP
jgi:hypothetical protein